jgi:hypothetical protein
MRWRKANQNKRRSFLVRQIIALRLANLPEPSIVVSLCCRDGNGNHEGRLYKISIGEFEMELDFMEGVELAYLDPDKNPKWYPAYIKVIDRIFPVTSCRQYYGNLCWDGVEMSPYTVIALLNYLMTFGFTPECAPTELYEAFDKKQPLGVRHIPLLMDDAADWDYHNFMR